MKPKGYVNNDKENKKILIEVLKEVRGNLESEIFYNTDWDYEDGRTFFDQEDLINGIRLAEEFINEQS